MEYSLSQRVVLVYKRTRNFFAHDIWDRKLDELSARTAFGYRAARIAQHTVRSLVTDETLTLRGAALTYYTVLSLVPFLAFVFAVLKGFGAYDQLVEESIRPYVLNLLSGNEALRSATDKILSFVQNTGVTSLGFIGLLTVLYASTRLLKNIEDAFNAIWEVSTGRTWLEQLRDYLAIITVTPICLMAGAALTTAGQAVQILRAAGETLGISSLVDPLIGFLGPLGALFLGLLFLYKVMPHTSVRISSAALGASIGAVLWYLVLIAQVQFQVGVARFNALYSSFAAIPIFLVWLNISWLAVLVGALIAATHQNSHVLAQRARMTGADQALKETVSLAATLQIGRGFMRGEPPRNAEDLAAQLDVHPPLLVELLDRLVDAGILLRAEPAVSPRYILGRPTEQVRVKEVLDALRHEGTDTRDVGESGRVSRAAISLWNELDEASQRADVNRSLREILDEME